ncbi:MAG TPA: hypothetical protein VN854_00185 [Mycoplasmatales bacterium]|jgi:hypothetical protein|nr:hypothetical protein [Mycoplasmatales bacterium]
MEQSKLNADNNNRNSRRKKREKKEKRFTEHHLFPTLRFEDQQSFIHQEMSERIKKLEEEIDRQGDEIDSLMLLIRDKYKDENLKLEPSTNENDGVDNDNIKLDMNKR